MNSQLKDLWVFAGLLAISVTNFLVFGLNHIRSWKDASQYSAYASNILQGSYSFDGQHFSALREPGYPFFLAFLYKIFGNENLLAVCFVQALLLGVLGFFIYSIFTESGYRKIGVICGACVSSLPFYGFYSNEILSEFLFAFFLGLTFYVCAFILRARGNVPWFWLVLLGVACGYQSLIRFQFVFFLPFIIICFLVFVRPYPRHIIRNIVISLFITARGVRNSWDAFAANAFCASIER